MTDKLSEKDVTIAINEVTEKLTLLWERLAEARGFGPLYGQILASLYISEKPLSQKELSERTKFGVPAVSKTLDQLVALNAVRRFKKQGERTYYYSALSSPREMILAGLGKWVEEQRGMRAELSPLEAKLRSLPKGAREKKEIERLLVILEDLETTFDETERAFLELKKRLVKT
jgi:DNA-binding transcriptional regulator GbsR (MarR family)